MLRRLLAPEEKQLHPRGQTPPAAHSLPASASAESEGTQPGYDGYLGKDQSPYLFMVMDYMDFDLAGLMKLMADKKQVADKTSPPFSVPQVSASVFPGCRTAAVHHVDAELCVIPR